MSRTRKDYSCKLFPRHFSRSGSQLHSHVLVSNLGLREDGSWGTIVGRDLFQKKMALGALYRAELSKQLSEHFEVAWVKEHHLIELKAVRKEFIEIFAKRRKEIEELLKKRGVSGARSSEFAALDSRSKKEVAPRHELFSRWKEEALLLRLPLPHLKIRKSPQVEVPKREIPKSLLPELLERQSYFSTWDLIKKACESSLGSGEGANEVLNSVASFLKTEPEIVYLGEERKEGLYTSKAMYRAESELMDLFSSNAPRPIRSKESLGSLIKKEGLNEEQSSALSQLVEGHTLSIISGLAGTGKSRLLKAGRLALESAGLSVIGSALSGKASEGLEGETGIKSITLHKLMLDLRSKEQAFSKKTVLIVDEAAMVGTLMLKEVSEAVVRAGGRLVLVGDERQLQSIEAGGAFHALQERYGSSKLCVIRRQRSAWDKARIMELVHGKAERAFGKYAESGKLIVGKDETGTMRLLLSAWSEQGIREPKSNLILSSENTKVEDLNREAQKRRLIKGVLGATSVTHKGAQYFVGDRILFTRNSKLIGVKNGSLGTVTEVQRKYGKLCVELDSGKTVRVKPRNYPYLKLGYAVTTHKAQGLTTENVFVSLGGSLQDRELSYVQASRARGDTRFFISEEDAGEKLRRISFLASESHMKKLAIQIRESKLKGVA